MDTNQGADCASLFAYYIIRKFRTKRVAYSSNYTKTEWYTLVYANYTLCFIIFLL